MKSGLNWKRS